MARSGRKAYSDKLELQHMIRHQEEDKRKRIFITAESYAVEGIDLTNFIKELKSGYESMAQINLRLASEAFQAENEDLKKYLSHLNDQEDCL